MSSNLTRGTDFCRFPFFNKERPHLYVNAYPCMRNFSSNRKVEHISSGNLRVKGVLPEHPKNSILMDIQPYHVLGWTLTNTAAIRLMKRWYTTEWRSVLAVNNYRDEWNICHLDTSWCKGQCACLEDCWRSEARVRSQLWSPEDGFVKSCLLVSTT